MTFENFTNDAHGWAELLPPRIPNPSCKDKHRVRWTVVGAGFTGLSCARRLAELHPNDEILLLDARAIAQAASGRNSGYAVAHSHFSGIFDPDQAANYSRINRINAAGLSLLRRQVYGRINTAGLAPLRNVYGSDNHQPMIHCQWHEQGFYHTAADIQSEQEALHFVDYLNKMGIAHIVLDQEQLTDRLGMGCYRRGVHVHDGVLVQPASLVYGLAGHLPSNVTLYEHSPVIDWNIGSNAPITLSTPSASIETDTLIFATNFEVTRLGIAKQRILGSTLSGSFTRQLTEDEQALLGNEPQWGVLSLHSGGATVRLTQDRRISIRNTAEYHGGRLLSDTQLKQRQSIHRKAFERRFPQLRHVEFEYAWSGVEGISRNSTNFFQNPQKNVYFAGGYNGSGVSRGTAFGAAMAEYISGEQSDLVRDCLASPQAQWIPPRPILDVGAWFTVRKRFKGVGRDR